MADVDPTAKPELGATKSVDQRAQDVIEGRATDSNPASDPAGSAPEGNQPAGPHADPALMSDIATPGAGALTPIGGEDEVEAASG